VPDVKGVKTLNFRAMRVYRARGVLLNLFTLEVLAMNRKIKQIINKFSYHRGIEVGKVLRTNLINQANALEKQGKTEQEIIYALGLPINEPDLIAQESAKCL
jgi:hypothetical protein